MSKVVNHDQFQTLVRTLHEIPEPDSADQWPVAQLELLFESGGYRWNIPQEFGGAGVDAVEILEIYRELALGSLLTTFILTQRNAACQRIESSSNESAKLRLLPRLCRGELFATVGISHLTTSRQHLAKPIVSARELSGDRFVLNGLVPWATAAKASDIVVTGGTLENGRQLLAAISTNQAGVVVQPPIPLMGLSSSQTSAIELHNVIIGPEDLLHGPVERVMSNSSGTTAGAGSLSTSAVAIGAAQGTLQMFSEEADRRPELVEFVSPLTSEAAELTSQLRTSATGRNTTGMFSSESIRQRANSLAIRAAQAWLAATKGAGYVVGHPAERAVRESMFFLVWSCPQSVLEGNLRELTCGHD